MGVFGMLMVIWALFLPFLMLPFVSGFDPQLGIVANVMIMHLKVWESAFPYLWVWVYSLFLIALGLSLRVLDPPRIRYVSMPLYDNRPVERTETSDTAVQPADNTGCIAGKGVAGLTGPVTRSAALKPTNGT